MHYIYVKIFNFQISLLSVNKPFQCYNLHPQHHCITYFPLFEIFFKGNTLYTTYSVQKNWKERIARKKYSFKGKTYTIRSNTVLVKNIPERQILEKKSFFQGGKQKCTRTRDYKKIVHSSMSVYYKGWCVRCKGGDGCQCIWNGMKRKNHGWKKK